MPYHPLICSKILLLLKNKKREREREKNALLAEAAFMAPAFTVIDKLKKGREVQRGVQSRIVLGDPAMTHFTQWKQGCSHCFWWKSHDKEFWMYVSINWLVLWHNDFASLTVKFSFVLRNMSKLRLHIYSCMLYLHWGIPPLQSYQETFLSPSLL